MNSTYGKEPENPVQLNSISAARLFLDHLITPEGYCIVYHRLGSLMVERFESPIDHYEIMTADNRYDDIFINIYNEANNWIPPTGYLFFQGILFYPEGINEYAIEEINEQVLSIEDKYLYYENFSDDSDEEVTDDYINEVLNESDDNTPLLDMFLCHNCGVNSRISDFPYSMIVRAIDPEGRPDDEFFKMLLEGIKSRRNHWGNTKYLM